MAPPPNGLLLCAECVKPLPVLSRRHVVRSAEGTSLVCLHCGASTLVR